MNCNGSYLCERLQGVKIGNSQSDRKTIQHVVPQESILGLFFSKRSHSIFVSWTCLLNTVYRWNNIVTKMFKNNFELQSWFKSNYLRHLSGEESNTKSITIINHDTIWLNQQVGKVKRTCFYCLFLVFIYYLLIYFLHFFDLDFVSVRIQRKKITWQISSRLSCPHA